LPSRSMPNITASRQFPIFSYSYVMQSLDSIENAFCSCNLVGTHDHQYIFLCGENTILSLGYLSNACFAKKVFVKSIRSGMTLIIGISPKRGKLKAITGFLPFFALTLELASLIALKRVLLE
jgi:hypothetical protein